MLERPLAVDRRCSDDEVRQFVSTQSTSGIDAFGREAQAT
jgi:hypothetical protein